MSWTEILPGTTAQRSDVFEYGYTNDALADDGTANLIDATDGFVIVSCNAECGIWNVRASGAVYKVAGTTNTAATDSDGSLCVYQSSTTAVVKNRLGATGAIRIVYRYN